MCGFAGFVSLSPREITPELVHDLYGALKERGPDDMGYFSVDCRDGEVSKGRDFLYAESSSMFLLHRRLSIIGIDQHGWQPMSTEDGRYTIVYNGELYNYKEIKKELEDAGVSFFSRTDTEVMLKAFATWRYSALEKLEGMYAFALFDRQERSLTLVRDPFGIKPLYYFSDGNALYFGSTLAALQCFSNIPRELCPKPAFEFLRFGLTDRDGSTLLKNVFSLPPASLMTVSLEDCKPSEIKTFWTVSPEINTVISYSDAVNKLRELFVKSIRMHLRSDVPLGAALSGGIDSSSIVMMIREILGSEAPIHAFSFIAKDSPYDEEQWIDCVVDAAKVRVHKIFPKAEDLASDLPALVVSQGEPFASTSIYAQRRVFEEAHSAGIKVMLDGQGADEIFAGYEHFIPSRIASLFSQGKIFGGLRLISDCRHRVSSPFRDLFLRSGQFLLSEARQEMARKIIGKPLVPDWLNWEWFAERETQASFEQIPAAGFRGLKRELYRSLTDLCIPHLLRYADRNAMAFSIENRVPFLNRELIEFAYSLPEEFLIGTDGTSKKIFRDAMRGIVPDQILDRRDKVGFTTPEQDWISSLSAWVEKIVFREFDSSIPFLNRNRIMEHWDAIVKGTRQFDNSMWRCLNFLEWMRSCNIKC